MRTTTRPLPHRSLLPPAVGEGNGAAMDAVNSRDSATTLTAAPSRHAAFGRLADAGFVATLLAASRRGTARAQETPGLRSEQPDRYILTGAETRISYEATAAGGPRLTYDGPYGSHTLGEDVLTTEAQEFGRLITAPLGAFPDRGDLSLTLLLPWFNPRTIGSTATDPVPLFTLAILTWVVGTIAGPPVEGAWEEYEVVELEGTAQLVGTLPAGIVPDLLITTSSIGSNDLPPTVDTLALARVTLPPGATAAAENGAHYFLVEGGALTVRKFIAPGVELPGGSAPATAGGLTYVDYDDTLDEAAPPTITNEGTEPAVALVLSLAATGGAGLEAALTGWESVEVLAVADTASLGPPFPAAGESVRGGIGLALVRVTYEPEVSVDLGEVLEPATVLLVVESGGLDVQVSEAALLTPAGGPPESLPPETPMSIAPGDQLLVPSPGRATTQNVARDPKRDPDRGRRPGLVVAQGWAGVNPHDFGAPFWRRTVLRR